MHLLPLLHQTSLRYPHSLLLITRHLIPAHLTCRNSRNHGLNNRRSRRNQPSKKTTYTHQGVYLQVHNDEATIILGKPEGDTNVMIRGVPLEATSGKPRKFRCHFGDKNTQIAFQNVSFLPSLKLQWAPGPTTTKLPRQSHLKITMGAIVDAFREWLDKRKEGSSLIGEPKWKVRFAHASTFKSGLIEFAVPD